MNLFVSGILVCLFLLAVPVALAATEQGWTCKGGSANGSTPAQSFIQRSVRRIGSVGSVPKSDLPEDVWHASGRIGHRPEPNENASEATGGKFAQLFNANVGRGIHKWVHYFPAYYNHLSQFIGKEVHIVEIGVASGGSLKMWKEVFGPQAHVYGIDIIENCRDFAEDRVKIFIGDAADPEFWANFRKQVPRVDVLIDDGSHTPDAMLTTLGEMLPHIAPGGVFMVEDVVGAENGFWHALNLQAGFSTESTWKFYGKNTWKPRRYNKSYPGFTSYFSSVHIYPYMFVLERTSDMKAIARQLGSVKPAHAILQSSQDLNTDFMPLQEVLRGVLPSFQFSPGQPNTTSPSTEMDDVPREGLLVLAWHGTQAAQMFSRLDWGSDLHAILHSVLDEFGALQECGDFSCEDAFGDLNAANGQINANHMQMEVDSVHIYPSLALVKRTDEIQTSLKAVKRGVFTYGPTRCVQTSLTRLHCLSA